MPATDYERLIVQFEAQSNKLDNALAGISSKLDRTVANVETRTSAMSKNVEQSFASVGRRLAAFVSVTAVLAFTRSLLTTADALQDTAQQLGVTTQELQGLSSAARDTGANADGMKQALGFLTDGLGDAAKGEGNLAKVMRELNIPMGTTMQVLFDLADRVQKAATQNEKMAITTAALGRAGRQLVPILSDGAAGLRRYLEEAQKKGQIWDPETVAQLGDAYDAIERLKVVLAGTFANPFAVILNTLLGVETKAEHLAKLVSVLGPRLTHSNPQIQANLDRMRADVLQEVTGGTGNLADVRRQLQDANLKDLPFLAPESFQPKRSDVPEDKTTRDKAKVAAEKLAAEQIKIEQENAAGIEEIREKILKERMDAVNAGIEFELEATIQGQTDMTEAWDRYGEGLIEAWELQQEKRKEFLEEQEREVEQFRDSFRQDFEDLLRDLEEGAPDAGKNFVRALLSTMLDEMNKNVSKAIIDPIFNALRGGMSGASGGGGSGGSIWSTLLGAASSALLGGMGGGAGRMFGGGPSVASGAGIFEDLLITGSRAGGGSVKAGHRYRVNEEGEETFIPGQNGYIMPNFSARSGSGGNSNVHVQVTASKEFEAKVIGLSNHTAQQVVAAYEKNVLRGRVNDIVNEHPSVKT